MQSLTPASFLCLWSLCYFCLIFPLTYFISPTIQGSANHNCQVSHTFGNHVLLGHSHVCLWTCVHGCFHAATAELNICSGGQRACKPKVSTMRPCDETSGDLCSRKLSLRAMKNNFSCLLAFLELLFSFWGARVSIWCHIPSAWRTSNISTDLLAMNSLSCCFSEKKSFYFAFVFERHFHW